MNNFSQKFLGITLLLLSGTLSAQNVGINATGLAPAASSGLDINFTDRGLLIPRVALTATNVAGPVAAPLASLLVYNTSIAGVSPNNVLPGYYYWDGAAWIALSGSGGRDWSLLGNAGTAVGTNFLGTTDNNSLAFRTNNVERMRLRNDGIMTVNSGGGAFAASTLYSLATGNDNAVDGNAAGTGNAIYGQNTGTGNGVLGLSNTATGQGVQATNLHASGTGLVASGNNAPGNFLVVGSGGGFTGTGIAIAAWSTTVASGNGIAAAGNNLGLTTMVGGAGGTFISTNIGASGLSPVAAGNGLYGENTTASGAGTGNGVVGITAQSNGAGILGQNSNGGGVAVEASNTGAAGGGLGVGVLGRTSQSAGTGVTGSNLNAAGTGVAGAGNNIGPVAPVVGAGGSFIGNTQGIFVRYLTGGVGQGIAIQDGFGAAWNVGAWNGVYSKITGTGGVGTVVKDLNGQNVTMYCPESPEILFQDYGEGKLVNGKVHIELDPILAKNIIINEEHPLRVYVQLEGNCKGVYVANKTTTGFDVIELDGGTSNVQFQYTVVCNRADEEMLNGRVSHYSSARWIPSAVKTQEVRQLYNGGSKLEPKKTKVLRQHSEDIVKELQEGK